MIARRIMPIRITFRDIKLNREKRISKIDIPISYIKWMLVNSNFLKDLKRVEAQ